MLVNMEVVGVRIEMPSNQPIVLLKEIEGSRFLPIWVGAVEATAIAFAQQGMAAQRPLTHCDTENALTALQQVDDFIWTSAFIDRCAIAHQGNAF